MNKSDPIADLVPNNDIRIENDPLAHEARYWTRGTKDGQWFRLLNQEGARMRSHASVNSVPVNAMELQQVTRGLLSRFFNKRSDKTELCVPGESKEMAEVVSSLRSALLAWSAESGLPLEPNALQELFGYMHEIKPLRNGMALVYGAEQPLSAEERENAEVVRAMADRILEKIKGHGTVVADLQSENAQRLCIGIKQVHFHHDDLMPDVVNHNDYLEAYLGHQRALLELQCAVAESAQLSDIHFFIEGLSQKINERQGYLQCIRDDKTFCLRDATNLRSAKHGTYLPFLPFDQVKYLLCRNDIKTAAAVLRIYSGSEMFIKWAVASGLTIDAQIHGLSLSKAETDMQKKVWVEAQRSAPQYDNETSDRIKHYNYIEWFRKLHPFLVSKLDDHVEKKQVGIIVLGAAHFINGYRYLNSELEKNLHVEDYLMNSNALRDLRLIVVDPHSLKWLESIHEELDQR